MQINSEVRNALLIAVASCTLISCGSGGTSKSSSNRVADTFQNPVARSPQQSLTIDQHNAHGVASSTLKSVLLSDASVTALDQAVYVTQDHSSSASESDIATGVVLTFNPVACIWGGTFTIGATIESADDQFQVDFNNPLNLAFSTDFDECNQGVTKLSGSVSVDFTAMLNDLLNNQSYSFDAVVNINNLAVEQYGFYPFTFDGQMSYGVTSTDGNRVETRITADHTLYTADVSYQFTEFESIKVVNQSTAEYEYSISGELSDDYIPDSMIRYHTLEPLTGQGFSIPSGGQIAVEGVAETLYIQVLNDHDVLLSLDVGNNGIIDHESQSTWQELVINDLQGWQ